MKKILISLCLIIAITVVSGGIGYGVHFVRDMQLGAVGSALTPHISIIAPSGDEVVQHNFTLTIKWSTQNFGSKNLRISLYRNNQYLYPLTGSIANTGSYSWKIPASTTPGTDYQIKIIKFGEDSVQTMSKGFFTIKAESLACTALSKTIRLGDTDAKTAGEVTKLQKFLVATNYLDITKTETGYGEVGGYTVDAIKAFQSAQGLDASTGSVGPNTRDRIKSISCVKPSPTPTATSTPTPSPTIALPTPTTIVVENFENTSGIRSVIQDTNVPGWKLSLDPGAVSTFNTDIGFSGTGGRLDFNFNQGGNFVLASKVIENGGQGKILSFRAKSVPGLRTLIRIMDSSGQTLQFSVARPVGALTNSWYKQVVDVSKSASFWGGTNNGILTLPIKKVEIGVEPIVDYPTISTVKNKVVKTGSFYIDDIILLTLQETEEVNPNAAAIIPATQPTFTDTIGLSTHASSFNPTGYQKITETGIKIVRTDIWWNQVEKQKGVYTFEDFDPVVNQLTSQGIKVVLILNAVNKYYPLYNANSTAKDPAVLNPIAGATNNEIAEYANGFAAYAMEVAKHYKGKDVVFEIFNEPNLTLFKDPTVGVKAYAQVAKKATASIHGVNPSAYVAVGALANSNNATYINRLIDNGGLDGANALSWHPYVDTPELLVNNLLIVKDILAKRAPTVQLFNSETGYSSAQFTGLLGTSAEGRARQAQLIVRQFALYSVYGLPYHMYYDLKDDGQGATNREFNYGLYDFNFNEKPSGKALKYLVQKTQGLQAKGLLATKDSSTFVYKFENASKTMLIAWNANFPVEKTMPVILTQKPLSVTDYQGNDVSYSMQYGKYTVNISGAPVYITFTKSVADRPAASKNSLKASVANGFYQVMSSLTRLLAKLF